MSSVLVNARLIYTTGCLNPPFDVAVVVLEGAHQADADLLEIGALSHCCG